MNWHKKFLQLKKAAHWTQVLTYLESLRHDSPNNVEIWIETIWFLSDLLLEDSKVDLELETKEIAGKLKNILVAAAGRFANDSEYLFFVGHLIALTDWILGEEVLDVSREMRKRAAELEPRNDLYQWGYRVAVNDRSSKDFAGRVLSDSKQMEWLRSKGMAGEEVVTALRYCDSSK